MLKSKEWISGQNNLIVFIFFHAENFLDVDKIFVLLWKQKFSIFVMKSMYQTFILFLL